MKTYLNNIRLIDNYISGKLSPEDHILFEAKLLIDPVLKLHVDLQRKIVSLVRLYARKQIKSEVEAVSRRIFQNDSKQDFQRSVHQAFKNK